MLRGRQPVNGVSAQAETAYDRRRPNCWRAGMAAGSQTRQRGVISGYLQDLWGELPGADHLHRILEEAQTMVCDALGEKL